MGGNGHFFAATCIKLLGCTEPKEAGKRTTTTYEENSSYVAASPRLCRGNRRQARTRKVPTNRMSALRFKVHQCATAQDVAERKLCQEKMRRQALQLNSFRELASGEYGNNLGEILQSSFANLLCERLRQCGYIYLR
jgi:hypothetical protein